MSKMDKMGNSGDDKAVPFKLFEPATLSSPSPSSDSQLNLAVGSPTASSSKLDLQQLAWRKSPSRGGEDIASTSQFTVFRRPTPRSRSPPSFSMSQSDMVSSDLFQSPSASSQPKRLHVSNIPFRYREHNLVMLFGKFGTVVEAEIIYNDKGSKGFGFVTMSRGKDADYALRKLNHAIVEGRVIEVNLATPKIKGFKVSATGTPPGVFYADSALCSLTASKSLAEAEARLAEAKLEVLKIRSQMRNMNID